MKRQYSWKQYRTIDLAMLAAALAVFEFIIVRATGRFTGQPYTVSLAAALTSIVYMRWGAWGAIHAAEAGFVFCLFSGATRDQYLIYCVGNLFSVFAVLLLRAFGKERVRNGNLALVFPALVLLLMQGGRAVTAMALGAAPGSTVGFFTTDSLSLIFTLVIIWIARRLDGIYEDQKHYLLRIHDEEKQKEVNYES